MATDPPLIPRDVLFGNPEKVLPRISPDGRSLAYVAPVDGVLNVWVGPVDGEATPVTDDRERGVRQYFWAHDGRHLLYLQDRGGDENWRLYAVELSSRAVRDLTPFEGVQTQVVEVSKHHPDTILVGLNRDRAELHDVYELQLSTGVLEKVVENPGFVGWAGGRPPADPRRGGPHPRRRLHDHDPRRRRTGGMEGPAHRRPGGLPHHEPIGFLR